MFSFIVYILFNNIILNSHCFSSPHTSKVDEAPVAENNGGGLPLCHLWHHTAKDRQLVQRAIRLHIHQQNAGKAIKKSHNLRSHSSSNYMYN